MGRVRELLEEAASDLRPAGDELERTVGRAERRARRQRRTALLTAIVVAAVGIAVLAATALGRRSEPAVPTLQPHRNGAIVILAFRYPGAIGGDLYLVNPDGTRLHRLTRSGDATVQADFSPDGTRLVFANSGGLAWNISVMNPDGTDRHQITPEATSPGQPVTWEFPSWLPDGSGVRFYRNDGGGPAQGMWEANADGSNLRLVIPRWVPFGVVWSPDGTRIAWEGDRGTGAGGADLFVGDPTGVHRQRLTFDPGSVGTIAWSPDGKRIVFENSGAIELIDADGTDRRTLFRCDASCRGAAFPVWSPDGRQIAFTVGMVEGGATPTQVKDRVEVMNADGTDVHPLIDLTFAAIPVAWQPLLQPSSGGPSLDAIFGAPTTCLSSPSPGLLSCEEALRAARASGGGPGTPATVEARLTALAPSGSTLPVPVWEVTETKEPIILHGPGGGCMVGDWMITIDASSGAYVGEGTTGQFYPDLPCG